MSRSSEICGTPWTVIVSPTMYDEAGLARNCVTSASSSTVPIRRATLLAVDVIRGDAHLALDARRRDEARRDAVDADVVVGPLVGERRRQVDHGGLGRAVGLISGEPRWPATLARLITEPPPSLRYSAAACVQ